MFVTVETKQTTAQKGYVGSLDLLERCDRYYIERFYQTLHFFSLIVWIEIREEVLKIVTGVVKGRKMKAPHH